MWNFVSEKCKDVQYIMDNFTVELKTKIIHFLQEIKPIFIQNYLRNILYCNGVLHDERNILKEDPKNVKMVHSLYGKLKRTQPPLGSEDLFFRETVPVSL